MKEQVRQFITKNGLKCIIRQATEEDCESIVNLINSIAAERVYIGSEGIKNSDIEEFKKRLRKAEGHNSIWYVAEIDKIVVGNINVKIGELQKTSHTATFGMGVISKYRNIGIGSALVETALNWLKEKRIEKVSICVFSTNIAAINLYKKYGFEIESTRKKQYKINGKYVDEISMAKWL
jgi:hypothetical protein